ncbi:MAG: protoporphyrinogen oxidase HemJ [Pseudolabrys sp.]|nr:protoporphyrinogen oxidase HemJ [Pseudolabrys sp.]
MLYLWIKALHVISVIAWMAGMLYLPRLFVYHADAAPGSDKSETFKIMERRLLKAIINPAMIATWVFGLTMVYLMGWDAFVQSHWLHAKLLFVLVMSGLHGYFVRLFKTFAADRNTRPAKFYRIVNEIPTALLIVIVALAVVKPF